MFWQGRATIAATAQQVGTKLQRETGKGQQAKGNRDAKGNQVRTTGNHNTSLLCWHCLLSKIIFKCQKHKQAGGNTFGSAKTASCFFFKPYNTEQELLFVICMPENQDRSPTKRILLTISVLG